MKTLLANLLYLAASVWPPSRKLCARSGETLMYHDCPVLFEARTATGELLVGMALDESEGDGYAAFFHVDEDKLKAFKASKICLRTAIEESASWSGGFGLPRAEWYVADYIDGDKWLLRERLMNSCEYLPDAGAYF